MIILAFILCGLFAITNGRLGTPTKMDPNDPIIQNEAIYAINEYSKSQNSVYELVKVLNATQQLVAGTLYKFTVEVIECGKNQEFKCDFQTIVVPWLNEHNLLSSLC